MSRIVGPGGPFDHNAVLVDARGAVPLDNVGVCMVDVGHEERAVALELGGRVNKSSARSNALYLFDPSASAKLAADLIGLAHRNGTGEIFMAMLGEHLAGQV